VGAAWESEGAAWQTARAVSQSAGIERRERRARCGTRIVPVEKETRTRKLGRADGREAGARAEKTDGPSQARSVKEIP